MINPILTLTPMAYGCVSMPQMYVIPEPLLTKRRARRQRGRYRQFGKPEPKTRIIQYGIPAVEAAGGYLYAN
jgi:hypothetical protein